MCPTSIKLYSIHLKNFLGSVDINLQELLTRTLEPAEQFAQLFGHEQIAQNIAPIAAISQETLPALITRPGVYVAVALVITIFYASVRTATYCNECDKPFLFTHLTELDYKKEVYDEEKGTYRLSLNAVMSSRTGWFTPRSPRSSRSRSTSSRAWSDSSICCSSSARVRTSPWYWMLSAGSSRC